MVIGVNLLMSLLILPRLDLAFLAEPLGRDLAGGGRRRLVGGHRARLRIVDRLIAVNWRRLPALRATMDAGANASVLPIISVASLVGFGAVVAALPAFDVVARLGAVDRRRAAGLARGGHQHAGRAYRLGVRRPDHRARCARQTYMQLAAADGIDPRSCTASR